MTGEAAAPSTPSAVLPQFAYDVKGGFWSDIDPSPPRVLRWRDRVFVGNAALNTDDRNGDNGTWLPNGAAGASWAPRDSQFSVMQDIGCIAISGLTRSGDNDAVPISAAAIGVGGFAVANSSIGRSAWGLYSDVQFESGSYGYGLEIAVKNKGADRTSTPYFATTGTYGIWLPGGGDNSYGGSAANPNNTAIAIGKNATTWNRGIVFFKDGLTGTDGTTGTATAIEMAKGHEIKWRAPGNFGGFTIRSDVSANLSEVSILAENNAISFFGVNGKRIADFQYAANGVNNITLRSAATGQPARIDATGDDANVSIYSLSKGSSGQTWANASGTLLLASSNGVATARPNYIGIINAAAATAPSVNAAGSDTNIDLRLSAKGTGVLRFGTYTALGAEVLAGYITIKDDAGNTRKVAVIA